MTAHYNQRTRGLDFECDFCGGMEHGKTELPAGWMRVTSRQHTIDGCADCIEELAEKEILEPLVDADCDVIIWHRAEKDVEND